MLIGLATLLVVIFVKPKRECITTLNAKCSRVYWPAGCHNCLPKRKYRYWGMTLNFHTSNTECGRVHRPGFVYFWQCVFARSKHGTGVETGIWVGQQQRMLIYICNNITENLK